MYIRGGLGFRVEGLGAAEAEGVCERERESERERERERDTHNKVAVSCVDIRRMLGGLGFRSNAAV